MPGSTNKSILSSMNLYPNHLFHIYNRGNNRQQIFFNRGNYLLFLKKIRIKILPEADILTYCLMPNHFHLMISTNENFDKQSCSNAFRNVLSSYTQAVNLMENRTGSLFTQNTKSKPLTQQLYAQTCFHYIHQNPVKSGLVERLNHWEFSSFQDYAGLRNGTLCNQEMARRFLDMPESGKEFENLSYRVIDPERVKLIF